MNQDRYINNSFDDYDDNTELLEDGGYLILELRQIFISHIASMFQYWERMFTFDKNDTTVYTGAAGAALLYVKLFEAQNIVSIQENDLLPKAKKQINSCLKYMKENRYTFLCGNIGVLTVKSLINSLLGKDYKPYLIEIAKNANGVLQCSNISDEVLYGRSGVLFSLLLIRSKLVNSSEIINNRLIQNLVRSILKQGQDTAKREKSNIPLVFYWHNKAYIGAAHGYSGILYMLLQAQNYMTEDELNKVVKPTIDFIHQLQFNSGNFPSSLNNYDDKLVHWCHGSPGVIYMLILAYEVFGDEKYLMSAYKCAEDIWTKGLLKKGTQTKLKKLEKFYKIIILFIFIFRNRIMSWSFGKWLCISSAFSINQRSKISL